MRSGREIPRQREKMVTQSALPCIRRCCLQLGNGQEFLIISAQNSRQLQSWKSNCSQFEMICCRSQSSGPFQANLYLFDYFAVDVPRYNKHYQAVQQIHNIHHRTKWSLWMPCRMRLTEYTNDTSGLRRSGSKIGKGIRQGVWRTEVPSEVQGQTATGGLWITKGARTIRTQKLVIFCKL